MNNYFVYIQKNLYFYRFFRWLQPEPNWRHKDFQSFALPTELQSQMVAREGFEPTTSGLWARRATRLLYLAMCCSEEHNLNGGGTGIRTQAPISRPTGFQDRTLQPLGYSSVLVDPEGLEPSTSRL